MFSIVLRLHHSHTWHSGREASFLSVLGGQSLVCKKEGNKHFKKSTTGILFQVNKVFFRQTKFFIFTTTKF